MSDYHGSSSAVNPPRFKQLGSKTRDLTLSVDKRGAQSWREVALGHSIRQIRDFPVERFLSLAHLVEFPAEIIQRLRHSLLESLLNVLDRFRFDYLLLNRVEQFHFECSPKNSNAIGANTRPTECILRTAIEYLTSPSPAPRHDTDVRSTLVAFEQPREQPGETGRAASHATFSTNFSVKLIHRFDARLHQGPEFVRYDPLFR
jgi:hypothetical protein